MLHKSDNNENLNILLHNINYSAYKILKVLGKHYLKLRHIPIFDFDGINIL